MKKADFPPLWPPGIHPVTLAELQAVTVTPFLADARRAIIFASFKQWIQKLQSFEVHAILWIPARRQDAEGICGVENMSIEFLRNHARVLSEFAAATTARAALNPDDFWLQIAAKNQQQAANDAIQALAAACAEEAGEIDKQEPFKRLLVDIEKLD